MLKECSNMRFWLEVSGDYQWQKKVIGELGLNAPDCLRYINLLSKIAPGDIILHYITTGDARIKGHQSAIVGISKAKTEMKSFRKKIFIDLEAQKAFPYPIKLKDFSSIMSPSPRLKFLFHTNVQRYLFALEKQDVIQLIGLNNENQKFITDSDQYGFLLTS
jgi:predicted RNA-binding protein